MKHNKLFFAATAFVLGIAIFGCKKDTPETLTPKITNDKVEVTATSATFIWTVDWMGKRISTVELSEHEDMSESRFFGSEEELNKSDFRTTAHDLKPATKYYYRHWVWNQNYVNNKFVMSEKEFTTVAGAPKVQTMEVTAVSNSAATVFGEVIDDQGSSVTERGVCWSTNHNPTTGDNHANNGIGIGRFSVNLTELLAGTTYYARAYAINNVGTAYGDEVTVPTNDPSKPEIMITYINVDLTSATINCNVITDGGAAVTNRGVCWSTSSNPVYGGNHQSVGNGTGSFSTNLVGLEYETQYHVRAYAINSVGTSYSDDMTFMTAAVPQAPTGAINGLFSVSETNKVWFSKGNLQFIGSASTPYWKFADNQWVMLGDQGQNSTAPNVNRDLFGWGTSGYHNSSDLYNINYQPYSTSTSIVNYSYNYYGYGPSTNQDNLDIAGTHYDWGVHNKIYNGGNWPGLWRTLTNDEWVYLLNSRQTSTINGTPNARFVKGKVNDVPGLILFPDSYTQPSSVAMPFGINDPGDIGWNYNSYGVNDWAKMEEQGCVFLPTAGYRGGSTVSFAGTIGHYWSSTCHDLEMAYFVSIYDNFLAPSNYNSRSYGRSVRLVTPAR